MGNLLTEVELLNLLDSLVKREVGAYGALINSTIDIEEATVANYSPGRNTFEFLSTEESEALSPRSDSCLDLTAPGEISPVIRCLFAHELGHWLAAALLGFSTEEVKLNWKLTRLAPRCEGSCTMHLGNSAVTLDFEDYLEKRIAILAAASLADCSIQYPTNKHIGIEFQKTLVMGTGNDDYQKILELFLIYRTRPRSIATKRGLPLDREPERGEIFESITKILQDLGIWKILRSEEYRSFVAVVIEAEQKQREACWQHDERVSLVIPGDRLFDHLAAKEDLQELIKQVAAAAGIALRPPRRSVLGALTHTAPAT